MAIRGNVDMIDVDAVAGWVLDEGGSAEQTSVDIFVGDRYVGSAVADIDAPDLYDAGLPKSARRFKFIHPNPLDYSVLTNVAVRDHKNQEKLDGDFDHFRTYLANKYNSPETLMPYVAFTDVKATADPSLYGYYKVEVTGDMWVSEDHYSDPKVHIEGAFPSNFETGLPTTGRAKNFWFYPDSKTLGFHFEATVKKPGDDLIVASLSYQDNGTPVTMPVAAIPVGDLGQKCAARLPDEDMIVRVIGPFSDAWKSYVVGGWTNVAQLDWMMNKYLGRPLSEVGKILDWGSGCARNTQPMIHFIGGSKVFGVDIDPVNIAWSKQHVPEATFEVSGLLPPLDFEDNSFDVVYGLSIFTHLTELAQDLWLAELFRVLKPGGIAFLTFHGEAAAYSRGFSVDDMENYRFRGIEEYVLDRALIEVVDDSNYYRSTFHTTDYLKSRWGKYFDVRGVEGTTGGYQWFAVCQKRADAGS